jgi:hypothetical protein
MHVVHARRQPGERFKRSCPYLGKYRCTQPRAIPAQSCCSCRIMLASKVSCCHSQRLLRWFSRAWVGTSGYWVRTNRGVILALARGECGCGYYVLCSSGAEQIQFLQRPPAFPQISAPICHAILSPNHLTFGCWDRRALSAL